MTDRKKRGKAFWATLVVLVVIVGYPFSYGPSLWLVRRGRLPNSAIRLYEPMTWFQKNIPGPPGDAVRWWAQIWQ